MHSWEESTGAPVHKGAPKPRSRPVLQPAADIARELESYHNGADIRTLRPARSSIAFPVFDVCKATAIDLAELMDEPVPKSRKICCRFHAESTPSLRIYRDHLYCYGCHAYGDHIDWLRQVEGLDHTAAQNVLASWTGPVISKCAATGLALEEIEQAKRDLAYVLRWWNAAKPIKGTLAARYLADIRGSDLDALPNSIDDTLRFHKRCIFGPGDHHPCLIALMRDGQCVAVDAGWRVTSGILRSIF